MHVGVQEKPQPGAVNLSAISAQRKLSHRLFIKSEEMQTKPNGRQHLRAEQTGWEDTGWGCTGQNRKPSAEETCLYKQQRDP